MPGISVFYKDDAGEVFHTYSTYGRGVEVMMGTYNLLDLTPKGRDERDAYTMEWVRHHDRYEPDTACEGGAGGRFVLRSARLNAPRLARSMRHGKPVAVAGGRRPRRPCMD